MSMSIVILGSTGSIGKQTAAAARQLGIRVNALAAFNNIEEIERQIREFKPRMAVLTDEKAAAELRIRVADTDTRVAGGDSALIECARTECDTLVNAVVGFAGLAPTLAAVDEGRRIALANKETLVAGGRLVTGRARSRGVDIFPIDSEHSAVFQALQASGDKSSELEKIILTASGGPFAGRSREQLAQVTPAQAVKHPNWRMGAKISVDSATMMNKGLEVIEAMRLFDVAPDMIEIVVHRESIIHSMVRFRDKSVIAQMSLPDMALPIRYALTYPERRYAEITPLDLAKVGTLSFEKPDFETFGCLGCAYNAMKIGGNAPAALNGANEKAVELFLGGKIGFLDIERLVRAALDEYTDTPDTLDGIISADACGRESVIRHSGNSKGTI